jgi:hypothetical protein
MMRDDACRCLAASSWHTGWCRAPRRYQVSWEDAVGALVLLQETGQAEATIEFGQVRAQGGGHGG